MQFLRRSLLAATAAGFVIFGGGTASAQVVTVDNLVYGKAPFTVRVPRIEFDGANLPEAELRAIFDPSKTSELAGRLKQLSARQMRIPEMVFDLDLGGMPGVKKVAARYLPATVTNITGGKAESMQWDGATAEVDDEKIGKIAYTFGKMTAKDIDFAGMVAMFTQAGKPEDGFKTLYSNFVADRFSMQFGSTATVEVGKLEGEYFRMRPMKRTFADLFAMIKDMDANKGAPPAPEQLRAMIETYADLYDAYETGKLTIDGVNAIWSDKEKGPGILAIKRMTMGAYVKRRFEGFGMEGFDLNFDKVKFGLGGFTFKAMDLSGPIAAVSEIDWADLEGWMTENWRKVMPAFDGLGFKDIAVDVPNPDAPNKQMKFSLGGFDLSLAKHVLGLPTNVGLSLSKLYIDLANFPEDDEKLAQIRALGLKAIDMTSALRLRWDEASTTINLEEYSTDIAQVGKVNITGTIGNAVAELFGQDMSVATMAVLGLTVKEAKLVIANAGIAEKVLEKTAKDMGTTPDVLRQQAAGAAMMMIPQFLGGTPTAAAIAQAVAKFVQTSKTLTVEAKAKNAEGLGLADAMGVANPLEILEKVDLKAVAD